MSAAGAGAPVRPAAWLWALVAAAVLSQTAINLARPLISYKVLALGGGAVGVGALSAAFALLPVAFALSLGRLSDRASRLRVLLASGLVLLVAGAALLTVAPGLALLAVGAAALGMGHLSFTIAGQAAIAKFAPPHRVDSGFGWFTAAFAVGQLVGPLMGGALLGADAGVSAAERLDHINFALLLAGGIAILALPTSLVRFPAARGGPAGQETGSKRAGGRHGEPVSVILARPGVKANVFASLALLSTTDILLAFLPLMGEEAGVAPVVVGALLAVRAAATISSRLMLGALVRRWSRNRLVVASLLGAVVGLVATPLLLEQTWAAALALAVAGFFLGLGQPLTMTLVSQAVDPRSRGTALALRLIGNRIGQVALPGAAGLAAAPLGPGGAVWVCCVVLVAAALVRRRSGSDPASGPEPEAGS